MSNYKLKRKKGRAGRPEELKKALMFDRDVYDDHAGLIYSRLMSVTIWGLILSALVLGFINSGIADISKWDTFGKVLFYAVVVLFGIPSIFIFPTAFFLKQGKIRLYKESFIEIYGDRIIYQKVPRITGNNITYEPMVVTGIKSVEPGTYSYLITGDVLNGNTGRKYDSVRIPNAFEDMDALTGLAK